MKEVSRNCFRTEGLLLSETSTAAGLGIYIYLLALAFEIGKAKERMQPWIMPVTIDRYAVALLLVSFAIASFLLAFHCFRMMEERFLFFRRTYVRMFLFSVVLAFASALSFIPYVYLYSEKYDLDWWTWKYVSIFFMIAFVASRAYLNIRYGNRYLVSYALLLVSPIILSISIGQYAGKYQKWWLCLCRTDGDVVYVVMEERQDKF